MRRVFTFAVSLLWISALPLPSESGPKTFIPSHLLTALGLARSEMTPESLATRIRLMEDSQTFGILRDPQAVAGAKRIESPQMVRIFDKAERASGLPASLLQAMAYLESFGDARAQSPSGPKGIMQISAGTAKAMGLRTVYRTRYRTVSERTRVKNKSGRTVYKTVKRRIPYTVFVRDERMTPERAIPAAAVYLAGLQKTLGGLDWAIFAYHCGLGCVQDMQALASSANGLTQPVTVAKMFFGASPIWNQELYEAISREMSRDYSPTYWFRVMRAQQLLAMYKEDRQAFLELANYYRYDPDPSQRAQHRLAVWLKASDFQYQNCDDIKRAEGTKLARAFDDPDFFGFALDKSEIGAFDIVNRQYYLQATPAAIGTLTYIAYETRRLFEVMKSPRERFIPLDVTSLVVPMDSITRGVSLTPGPAETMAHCSGQVFDIDTRRLPPNEKQALDFILDDMGWEGYLGFVEESPNSGIMHIGCSPSSREFFTDIYQEAAALHPNPVFSATAQ